jgi:transposase
MLAAADLDVVHVPGLAVKTARRATRGGEHKSDPRDARVIADQVRTRDDLRRVTPLTDADADLALLVSRRRELVIAQTRRITRLRDLLCSIHPGLERVVDPTNKLDLALLARYVTPSEIRRAGKTASRTTCAAPANTRAARSSPSSMPQSPRPGNNASAFPVRTPQQQSSKTSPSKR